MRTKPVAFFHDMVTGHFYASRTYELDWKTQELRQRLVAHAKENGWHSDELEPFLDALSEVVSYTNDLEFHWSEDTPAEYRELETFWEMVKRGVDIFECIRFYTRNVPNWILLGYDPIARRNGAVYVRGWQAAFHEAIKIWTPIETRPEGELTDSEKADPLSGSAGSKRNSKSSTG